MTVARIVERPAFELMQLLAADVARWLAEAIDARGAARLAVPGGSTPAPFLEALGRARIDWARVVVCPTDERWVASDAERSNEALLRRTLLRGAAAARFVSLNPGASLDDQAIERVDAQVRAILPLDVCVLGMGEDGHTASLFPGADRLAEALDPRARRAVLALCAPGAPEPRISLSASALLGARLACLLMTGERKRRVLDEALGPGPTERMPVRAVLRGPAPVHVYCSTD